MAWVVLLLSGMLETAWAMSLKASEGFSRLWPSVTFGITATISMIGLAWALKTLPVGTAYAVWTGTGAVLTAIVGILYLKESASVLKLLSILLIVAGIVGLRLAAGSE